MKTKSDLLGWEGMRLRVMIREYIEQKEKLKALESQQSETATTTTTTTP
jgi:hypothetical protein